MRSSLLLFASLFLAVSLCWGQTSSQGTIYGAVVPGAQVTATNVATNLTRETATSATGDYRMDFLPPGKYQLTVKQQGFETATLTGITLLVGQALRVNAELKVGATTIELNVSATVTPLNTLSSSRGNVLENRDIQNLPNNGRDSWRSQPSFPGRSSAPSPWKGWTPKPATCSVSMAGVHPTTPSIWTTPRTPRPITTRWFPRPPSMPSRNSGSRPACIRRAMGKAEAA